MKKLKKDKYAKLLEPMQRELVGVEIGRAHV